MSSEDPWVAAVENQIQEEDRRKLTDKMTEMKIRNQQRHSSDGGQSNTQGDGWPTLSSENTDRGQSNTRTDGWPSLPPENVDGNNAGWNSNDSGRGTVSNSSRPPATGGAGRGRFKLRDNEQGGSIGSFSALGTGNGGGGGGGASFGQFGGFARATLQQTLGDQANRNNFASSSGRANFNFNTATSDNNGYQNPTPAPVASGTSTVGRLPEENWEDESPEKPMDNAEISFLNKILHDKLVNTKYDVEIERRNPNNPLFSVKSFEELRLSDELLQGVYAMDFKYPSKIQESALPALLADPPQNMIAQSQSGTGKTAAFVLTMLSRVDPQLQHPQCLCLSPTYELALQIGKVVEKMGQYLKDVKVAYAVRGGKRIERGMSVTEQILIGTPGTVLDWMLKFRCFDPKLLAVFVLDEADLMIGLQGHQDQSIRIHKQLSPACQHLLFSATYDEQIMDFAYKIISDPVVIRLRREEESLDYIKQFYVNCRTREDKYRALCNIYGTLTIGQAVIFCRTKKEASWLATQMTRDGHLVSLLSGDLDIEQRAAVFDRFKKGSEKVLISTNLTARGIDVEQVTIVINYDLPMLHDLQPDYETYLHRIGRTGRFGKAGIAINFIDNNYSKTVLDQIESHFGKKILPLDTEDVDALEGIEKSN